MSSVTLVSRSFAFCASSLLFLSLLLPIFVVQRGQENFHGAAKKKGTAKGRGKQSCCG
jgi:hypothetical protein